MLLSYKKFIETKLLNIFLIVQIVIVIVVLNISIGKIQHSAFVTGIVHQSEITKAYYVAPRMNTRFGLEAGLINKEFDQLFASLENIESIEAINKLSFLIPEVALDIAVMSYNPNMINRIHLPLSAGNWFTKESMDHNDFTPVIISHSLSEYYQVGDFITLHGMSRSHKLKVIGILDQQDYYLSFQAAGDFMCIDEIFDRGKNVILCPEKPELLSDKLGGYEQGKLIYFDEKTQAEKNIEELSSLKETCYINSIYEMIVNQRETNRHDVILQLVHIAIAVVLALAGIGGTNALAFIFKEKEFALYFMCGLRWKWCVFIVAVKNIILLILAAILSFVVLNYITTRSPSMEVLYNSNNFIVTFFVLCSIYLLTSLSSILRMYKKSPISIIRRWD
jgi:hypothetical protein